MGVGVGVGTAVGAGLIRLVIGAQATKIGQIIVRKNHSLGILVTLYCGGTRLLGACAVFHLANSGARILPKRFAFRQQLPHVLLHALRHVRFAGVRG